MNRSIVVSRYAAALVKLVRESGHGEIACSEAEALEKALHGVHDLQRLVTASEDVVSAPEKMRLLQSALDGKISDEMSRFLTLLNKNGRMEMVEDILRDFVLQYRRSIGVRKAHLIAVQKPSDGLLARMEDLVRRKTGDDVIFEVEVDPSLVGGFVLDLDDALLDASVKRQLERLSEQFIERNRRII